MYENFGITDPPKALSTVPKESIKSIVYVKSFQELVAFMKKTLVQDRKLTTISNLAQKYRELQTPRTIEIKGIHHKDVKRRLKRKYGDDLTFYQKSKRKSEYVYCKSMPIEEDERSLKEKVEKVAEILREKVENFPSLFQEWPPHPDVLYDQTIAVPSMLQSFLQILLSEKKTDSARVIRLTTSVGDDVIYSQSKWKNRTIKHLQLGIITKRQTGSRFLIESLNRLVHSRGSDEVNNVETYFAEIQAKRKRIHSFVPNIVRPFTFVTFVYDNCDHNPETLSGMPLHCTNGIIIHRPTLNDIVQDFPQQQSTDTFHKRKRSFEPIDKDETNHIPIQKKITPTTLESVKYLVILYMRLFLRKEDLIWAMSRFQSVEIFKDQKVAGWTGSHEQVSSPECKDEVPKVIYLPSIGESPTKVTVLEVLQQVKAKAEYIGLKEGDLVLDHAIYKLALEVLMDPKNEELKSFISLRMGVFHASCIFIAAIGKRFAAAGLQDLCIEADLVGTTSVEKIIKGKQYNRAVWSLKVFYEALHPIKLEAFEEWLLSTHHSNADLLRFLESE